MSLFKREEVKTFVLCIITIFLFSMSVATCTAIEKQREEVRFTIILYQSSSELQVEVIDMKQVLSENECYKMITYLNKKYPAMHYDCRKLIKGEKE